MDNIFLRSGQIRVETDREMDDNANGIGSISNSVRGVKLFHFPKRDKSAS